MSIEVMAPTGRPDSFVLVSKQARRSAAEFLRLCRLTFGDPTARFDIATERNIARVLSLNEKVDLRAGYWRGIAINDEQPPIFISLGVADTDGSMSYKIEGRVLPFVDISKDPFAQHILDYFRRHYGV